MQPRLPPPARPPNPPLKGTRGYALVFSPYSARPRPLARALGTLNLCPRFILKAVLRNGITSLTKSICLPVAIDVSFLSFLWRQR